MTARNDTIAALQSEWKTRSEIHQAVGQWSHYAVKNSLAALIKEGMVESKLAERNGQPIRLYRRAADHPAPALVPAKHQTELA